MADADATQAHVGGNDSSFYGGAVGGRISVDGCQSSDLAGAFSEGDVGREVRPSGGRDSRGAIRRAFYYSSFALKI